MPAFLFLAGYCELEELQCLDLNFVNNSELISHTKENSRCVDSSGCNSGIITEQACNAVDGLFWDTEEYCNYITWTKTNPSALEINNIN